MKVLQICSELRDSKVHSELFQRLDSLGIEQTVFCFFRGKSFIGANQFESRNTTFIYADILSPIDKYFFYYKSSKVYNYLKKCVDLSSFHVVHAATLFTNGYIAYKIYKKYGIPYVVAVRSTDLMYYRIAPHTARTGLKILKNASKIVFISDSLIRRLSEVKSVKPYLCELEPKFVLQPNGINEFWHDHINTLSCSNGNKIIYVGNFVLRKNITRLIDAISMLRETPDFKDLTLTVVGGGKDKNGEMLKLIKSKDFVSFLGVIKDKEQLMKVYRDHSVFAMPSFFETFGLVYIEALTQNLPVIYSKNFGIDGMLPKTAGERVDPFDVNSIRDALKRILIGYHLYSNKEMNFAQYDWNAIVKNYMNMYKEITNIEK